MSQTNTPRRKPAGGRQPRQARLEIIGRSNNGRGALVSKEEVEVGCQASVSTARQSFESDPHSDVTNQVSQVLKSVASMNFELRKQIETLRLRLAVTNKQHEAEKDRMLRDGAKEMDKLKRDLDKKDIMITNLEGETRENRSRIQKKDDEIEVLKSSIGSIKSYTEELEKEVKSLRGNMQKMESRGDEEELQAQIDTMKISLASLEEELRQSNLKSYEQGERMRKMEEEKQAMYKKVRQDLTSVYVDMRKQVERLRDVVSAQTFELRAINEQQKEMRNELQNLSDQMVQQREELREMNKEQAVFHKDVEGYLQKIISQNTRTRESFPFDGSSLKNSCPLPPVNQKWKTGWRSNDQEFSKSKQPLGSKSNLNPSQ